jgi:hypothetical protein
VLYDGMNGMTTLVIVICSDKESQTPQPICDLLFYCGNNSKNKIGQGNKTAYIKNLLKDTNLTIEFKGDIELQIKSLQATMEDRKAWKKKLIRNIDPDNSVYL